MRILVLAPQWPDPPRQGAAIRNLHILLYLAQRHQVTLLTFEPQGEPQGGIDRSQLERVCEHIEVVPTPHRSPIARLNTLLSSPLPDMAWRLHSEAMQDRIRKLTRLTPFDAVHVEGIEMAPYGLLAAQLLKIQSPNTQRVPEVQNRLVYDAHNAEYLLQRRAFTTDTAHPRRWPKAFYSLVQWRRLRRFEKEVCLSSRHVLAVSEADNRALCRLAPDVADRISVLPNGVDPEYWSRDASYPDIAMPEGAIVFDGSMDFRPNIDAVLWFAHEVWPLILAKNPEACFFVVGRNPTGEVLALSRVPGITVTGAVDDPRPWVAGATVYVVPMRMGGGVRLKLLQAMAMGCAIVSTPMGAEGVNVRQGREMLLARPAEDFAGATLSLLSNPQRRASLGQAARKRASENYAWEKLLPTLDKIYPS